MVEVRCPAIKPNGRQCNHFQLNASEVGEIRDLVCRWCGASIAFKDGKTILVKGPVTKGASYHR